MDDLTRLWNAAAAFYDRHPLLTWFVTTALLNALVRAWPRLQHTLPGRLFSSLCENLGVNPFGLLKLGAAGAGAKAFGLAATGLGTTPEAIKGGAPSSSPPAILDTTSPAPEGEAPSTPRSGAPAAPTGLGGNGRRS